LTPSETLLGRRSVLLVLALPEGNHFLLCAALRAPRGWASWRSKVPSFVLGTFLSPPCFPQTPSLPSPLLLSLLPTLFSPIIPPLPSLPPSPRPSPRFLGRGRRQMLMLHFFCLRSLFGRPPEVFEHMLSPSGFTSELGSPLFDFLPIFFVVRLTLRAP